MEKAAELRSKILELAGQYFDEKFRSSVFVPGESPVPVSGKVLDAADLCNLIDASLDCWLTTGRFANEFERQFRALFRVEGRFAGKLRFLREPGGFFLFNLSQAGRSPPAAGR